MGLFRFRGRNRRFFTMEAQNERGYQNSKRLPGVKKQVKRYVRNVGLGFKARQGDVNASFVDKKCPVTGNVSISGSILTGTITKMKMQRTVIIRRDYLLYIKKYNRFEKRHKNMAVHLSPWFRDVKVGDVATVGECRPLS